MVFLYDLIYSISYFLFMIIFMVVAVLTAKRKGTWIWYSIGAILQLLALLGGSDAGLYWIIYFGLLIVTAMLIVRRKR